MKRVAFFLGLLAVLPVAFEARAVALLGPGDLALAIDRDIVIASSYPFAESPANAIDGNVGTKYLNFGKVNAGFIVTPASPTVVQSFQLTTANDAPARDPASWELYGTNDPIQSLDNSPGDLESWTLIGSGSVALPDARNTAGPVIEVPNSTAYSSYRVVFPTVKQFQLANSVQIAEVQLFSGPGGTGAPILAAGDPILAVHLGSSQSSSPGAEGPQNAVDGNPLTKYLNFGELNAGLILMPSLGPSVLTSFFIVTANDAPERDPAAWEIYGTNDPITSANHSFGDGENWILIDAGAISLPLDRLTAGAAVPLDNADPYSAYRFIVTEVRDPFANSVQFADIQLNGEPLPEPASWSLALLALALGIAILSSRSGSGRRPAVEPARG